MATRTPKSTPPKPSRPDMTIYGDSGLNRAAGYLYEEYLPELRGERGRRVLREMVNDPIIGGILFAVDMMIRRLEWRVEPASDDPAAHTVAERVEQAMNDMELTWIDSIAEAASFIPWGWAVCELEWKVCAGPSANPLRNSSFDDGWIAWKRWGIRAQDTLLHWELDDAANPIAMVQLVPYVGKMSTIPLDKCLHFKTVQRKNSPEGVSAIRACYTPYYFKKRIQQLEAIGIERNWVGVPVARIPSEHMAPGATSTTYQQFKTLVTNLRTDEQSGIVIPSDVDPETKMPLFQLELLQMGGAPTVDTDRVIMRHNHDIARALLAGFIFLADGQGSYALSVNQTGFFARALGAWVTHMAEVITKSAIEPMMRYNGVPQEQWPTLEHGEIGEIDMTNMADSLLSLAQAGMVDVADPDLRAFVAKLFGLPTPKQTPEQEQEADGGGAPEQDDAAGTDPNGPIKKLPVKEQADVPTEGETPKAAMEPSELDAALARFARIAKLSDVLNAEVA
jgi:hypothetical protein